MSTDMDHYDIYVLAEQGSWRMTTVISSAEAIKKAGELQRDERAVAIQIIAWLKTNGGTSPRLFYQFSKPDMGWIKNSPAAAIIFQLPPDNVASLPASRIDKPSSVEKFCILLAGVLLLAAAVMSAADLLD